MPEQTRDPAVHRVDRDGGRAQAVPLLEGRELAVGVEAAEQHDVRLRMVGERGAHLCVDLGDEVGGPLRLRIERLGDEGRYAGALRVGVGQPRVEARAAEHHEHPVLALVAEEHLDPRDLDRRLEQLDDLACFGVGDPPGATVG